MEEEKGQEPQEEQLDAEQTDDARSDALDAEALKQQIAEVRKEAASYRRKLRDLESSQQLAQEAKLKEEKKWQELAELKDKELTELKANLEDQALQNLRLEVAMRLGLPVKFADRLKGNSREELEEDATEILALLPKSAEPQRPTAPNIDSTSVPPAKPQKSATAGLTKEELRVAEHFNVTPEDYAKHK